MPTPLSDLIALAGDPAVKTTDLLRKAKVVARILKQAEWTTWIDHELRGYPDDAKLPSYRVIRCELKARNPFRGLIPIIIDHPEFAEAVSTCRIGQSISGLEDVAIPGKNVSMVLPPEMMALLMQDLNISMEPVRVVGGNQIRALVDAVRDQLLTWALDLVEAGIEGDEIPSPPQPLAPVTIRIDGGFHGGQLMVSSLGGLQQQTVTYPQKAADQPGGGQESELDTLKAQAAAPKWKLPVIAAVASTVVVILEGAGGGVLTDLVLKWLATLNGH